MLATLLWWTPAWALDPSKAITQYAHEVWRHRDGLPDAAVYQVLQTPDGYLWLRTTAGLARFDGVRFSSVEPDPEGAVRTLVQAIGVGTDGTLFVRSPDRTLRYQAGRFRLDPPAGPLPGGSVRVLFRTRDGRTWIGADDFVYRVGPRGMERIASGTGWVFAFQEDRRGRLWIGASAGLYRYQDGAAARVPGYPRADATAFAEDSRGGLWIGTRAGLLEADPDAPAFRPVPGPGARVTALLHDRDGNLWVGTDASGLRRLALGRWSRLGVSEGLSDGGVLALLEDREGSLWVGTKAGLDRLRDTKLTPLTTREGLAHDDVVALLEARDGSLYAFSDGGGLTRFEDGVARVFTAKHGLPSDFGGALYEARDGSLWIGTSRGLARYRDGAITAYAEGRLAGKGVSAVSEDDEGLLVATQDALVLRLRSGRGETYTVRGSETPLSRPGTFVFTMIRDPGDTLWFGTVHGLYRWSEAEGFAGPGETGITFPVTALHHDARDSLWIGSLQPGLTRLRLADRRVTRYTTASGLPDDDVVGVLTDRAGNLWASTRRGLISVGRGDLDGFAEGRLPAVRAAAFGVADGMPSAEAATREHQPAAWACRDGRLLFATRKGIAIVDPARLPRNTLAPPVRVEEVLADGERLADAGPVEVAPGRTAWEFRYTALSLRVPERVRFRYTLEGYDPGWTDAGARRAAYYTKLPPGRYRFRVVAANDDGVWNSEGAAFAFRLRPRFRESPWFYALAGAAAVLAALGAHRLRVGALRSRERRLARLVEDRTRALREECAILDTVLEQVPDHVYFKDAASRFTRINRATAAWFGLADSGRAVGKTDFDFFAEAHARQAFADEAEIMRTGRSLAGKEEQETWPDGRMTWVHTTKVPIRDHAGRVVGTMGISRDITARKQIEAELGRHRERLEELVAERTAELARANQALRSEIAERREAEEAARRAEEKYRAIFENAVEGIWQAAPDGRFLTANPALARIFGYASVAELIADAQGLARHFDAEPAWRAELLGLLERPGGVGGCEREARRLEGSPIWVSISGRAVRDAAGRILFYEGRVEDVTERKRAEHERLAHLTFLESMDSVNRAMQGASDPFSLMGDVLDSVLAIFACDRALLAFPCDPEAAAWRVLVERRRPEYPGALALGGELPMDGEAVRDIRILRAAGGPVAFGEAAPHPLPVDLAARFTIRSMLAVAVNPKASKPYMFALHQCSRPRAWTPGEARLFQEIGRRLEDALTGMLAHEELRESEHKLGEAERMAHLGYWDRDYAARRVALSQEARRILGLPPEEAVGDLDAWELRWRALIHPDDRERVAKRAADALAGGARYDVEYRVLRSGGELGIVRSRGDVTWDPEGRPRRMFGIMHDITELRQAERELRAGELRFRTFVDHASDAFFLHDADGTILDVNRQACESLGFTREELIGSSPARFDADLAPTQMDGIRGRLDAGEVFSFDTHHRRKDGSVFPVEVRVRPFVESGRRFGVSLARDITERERAQEELRRANEQLRREIAERREAEEAARRAEEKYRAIFENAVEGIYQTTPEGRFVAANPAMARILGYSSVAELIAETRSVPEQYYVQPERRLEFHRLIERHGSVSGFENEIRRRDGSRIWVSVSGRAVRDASGRLLYYEGRLEDVTERKRAEQAQAELRAALEKAALEWATTFDATEAPILILDAEGRLARLNSAAGQLAAGSPRDLAGRRIAELASQEPWRSIAELAAAVGRTRAHGHAEARHPVDGRIWDLTADPAPGPGAQGERVVVVARDLTRLLELQESLRRSETMSALGLLLGGVAHEVRNPLFAISANLDAFEARVGADSEFRGVIAVMRTEVDRLASLMRDLLEYGRPGEAARTPGPLQAVLDEAAQRSAALAERGGVRVAVTAAPDLPQLPMDRKRLGQVIQNLVENAVQHSPAGGTVTVAARLMGESILVTVGDSGPGFSPEDLRRVFEPFFSRRRGGTGLGLAIVQRIVEEHGGTITAANRPEGGALVSVRLPLGGSR